LKQNKNNKNTQRKNSVTQQPLFVNDKKRFAQFSHSLSDLVDYDRLASQSGYMTDRELDDYLNIENPPLFLVLLSLFALVYVPLSLLLYEYVDVQHYVSTLFYLMFTFVVYMWNFCVCVEISRLCYRKFFRKLYDYFNPPLQPQFGTQVDIYLKEAIQVWCLFESLKDCRSRRGMIAAITAYLQAHTNESLPLYVYRKIMSVDYISDWSSPSGAQSIEDMIDTAFRDHNPQADTADLDTSVLILDTNDGDIPWHIAMDEAFNNWKEFRHSAISHKITHFINVIVSAGMCSTAGLTFKLGYVNLFTPIVSKKQLNSGDIFEAFYEAVGGFLKGGWRVYKTGDVSTFFMEDDKVAEFDNEYNQLRSWYGFALAGNLKIYTDIDDNEFENRLNKAIVLGTGLLEKIKRSQTFERKYVQDRLDRMRDNLTEFVQLRTRGGLRIAPFAVCLFGQSGCGKSSLTNLSVNAGLIYNGLSAAKDRIATWADNDKFASSIRSHINAIIFDDFANTKEDFMDFSPAYRLIQVINNIRYLAPMADVFLKGKVSLNPYFCFISTNVEHLNAAKYSNEPESVLRRMYHVKVVPKQEYCTSGVLDPEKIIASFGHVACPDIWKLTVRRYTALNKRHVDIKAMVPVTFHDEELVDIGVKKYLLWLQVTSKEHFKSQDEYLSNQEIMPSQCKTCGMCYCDCMIPNAGEWKERYEGVQNWFHRKADRIQTAYEKASTVSVITARKICLAWNRIDFLPERYICHPKVLKFCLIFWREDLMKSIYAGVSFMVLVFLYLSFLLPCCTLLWLFILIVNSYWYVCTTVRTYECMISERILEVKDTVSTCLKTWQFKYALISAGAVGIVMCYLRNKYIDAQTGLSPDSIIEVNERNDKANPWLVAKTVPLPMSEPSRTTTSANLAERMRHNIIGMVSDANKTTLAFYIASNFVLVPTHFVHFHEAFEINVRCYRTNHKEVGGVFKDKLNCSFSVEIPGTDFTLFYVTGGGSMKDFRNFLPLSDQLPKMAAKLVTRDIMDAGLMAIPTLFRGTAMVTHTQASFTGGFYTLPTDTKSGMCMSPLISDVSGATIIGFHLAGKGLLGGCGILTLNQVNLALTELGQIDGVVLSTSMGDLEPNMGNFPSSTFGKEILQGINIHPKSAVNFLSEGANVDVYGTVAGKTTPFSRVQPTLISKKVEEIFGVEQQWGPPKLKGPGRYPYQATLEHAAVASLPLGNVLVEAVKDYKDLSRQVKEKIPELFNAKPLSRVATVCGLPGVKFIDPMNFSSSPGFPLSGSKTPLLVDLDPLEHPGYDQPRTFIDEVWKEFDETVETLRTGKRCYVIWKSCLKDESTKLTKDKVRVFQSAPLVLQLLVRMYFLPIVRIIQMNPITFECAVGINAEGPEWEELWDSAMSKGSERVLAGDYSKYDVRMPAQMTIAAFDTLIDIASQCDGYTSEDLELMRMMVHEVTYPVMSYNGDLIQLFGTNPSGQNLTVIINSVVNSLLLRCCFFTIYPGRNFKDDTSFMTYGDDVFGTVSFECPKFNHVTYASFLAQHDMKFTMPDKESIATEYMDEKDVDFLKRKCSHNPDLGRKVGLLAEESIFKRLHSHLVSKELTPEMHSAQNLESSAHDWFYYGREVFEKRVSQLQQVAKESNIEHLCPALWISYDERVLKWKQKYEDLEIPIPEPQGVLDTQCGDLYVSTVDHNDHCIGTAYNPYFWWEHISVWLSYLFLPIMQILIIQKKVTFTYHVPSFGWRIVIALLWASHPGYFFSLPFYCLFELYFPFFCYYVVKYFS